MMAPAAMSSRPWSSAETLPLMLSRTWNTTPGRMLPVISNNRHKAMPIPTPRTTCARCWPRQRRRRSGRGSVVGHQRRPGHAAHPVLGSCCSGGGDHNRPAVEETERCVGDGHEGGAVQRRRGGDHDPERELAWCVGGGQGPPRPDRAHHDGAGVDVLHERFGVEPGRERGRWPVPAAHEGRLVRRRRHPSRKRADSAVDPVCDVDVHRGPQGCGESVWWRRTGRVPHPWRVCEEGVAHR